jgi:hypothetical protein
VSADGRTNDGEVDKGSCNELLEVLQVLIAAHSYLQLTMGAVCGWCVNFACCVTNRDDLRPPRGASAAPRVATASF